MQKAITITQEGLEKLKLELDDLVHQRRPAIIERLQAARALGDLSENSEYDDARNDQSFVEGRIQELKETIKHARIVIKKSNHGFVDLGSVVECKIDNDLETFEIVGSAEADPIKNKISIDSPIGKALSGKRKGDFAEVNAPAGKLSYQILNIK